jgi:hypothetical protein
MMSHTVSEQTAGSRRAINRVRGSEDAVLLTSPFAREPDHCGRKRITTRKETQITPLPAAGSPPPALVRPCPGSHLQTRGYYLLADPFDQ